MAFRRCERLFPDGRSPRPHGYSTSCIRCSQCWPALHERCLPDQTASQIETILPDRSPVNASVWLGLPSLNHGVPDAGSQTARTRLGLRCRLACRQEAEECVTIVPMSEPLSTSRSATQDRCMAAEQFTNGVAVNHGAENQLRETNGRDPATEFKPPGGEGSAVG